MNLDTTSWFFKKFLNDNQCILYSGYFSEEILRKVMDISEISIGSLEEFRKKKKRMLFLMAEGFQNIIKHGEKSEVKGNLTDDFNYFLTINRGNAIFISTGNLIENKYVADLQKQLIEVNSLDEQGLKDLHSYVMKHGSLSHKGGAGLGLITIARKSDQKLIYSFEEFKSELSLYYNQIVLKSNAELSEESINALLPISEAIEYHKRMISENILMIQKGDFSHDSQNAILDIIENNLQKIETESLVKNKFYNIIVKILHNIDKHGLAINDKKEGILLLAKTKENYIINTGNYIAENKIEALEKRLSELNLRKEENNLAEDNQQGIGFIEIAKISKKPFDYSFEKIDADKYFFSLSVTI